MVNFKGRDNLIGKLVDIHIDEIRGNTLHGTLSDIPLSLNKKYEHKIL